MSQIRWGYFFEKVLTTLGTLLCLYVLNSRFTIPVLNRVMECASIAHRAMHSPMAHTCARTGHARGSMSAMEAILALSVPFMINYMLLFYILFECICNGLAEITRFADRDFYSDWWNSRTFDEYARKVRPWRSGFGGTATALLTCVQWNKPVHEFLLRHVYFASIDHYKVRRLCAGPPHWRHLGTNRAARPLRR